MSNDFVKQIIASLDIYSNIANAIAEKMRPTLIEIEQIRKQYKPVIQQISTVFHALVKENAHHIIEAIQKYVDQANIWQEEHKQNVVLMATGSGWFPNWFTFFYKPTEEVNDIDTFMTMHLNECWGELTDRIIMLCPNREHILKAAFNLHRDGNYIASIPLFISQPDGIVCEEIKVFLFAGKPKDDTTRSDKTPGVAQALEKMLERGDLQRGFYEDILLEPYKVKTQFSE
jgi:hypothetical protein